jgi:hypothetical protein
MAILFYAQLFHCIHSLTRCMQKGKKLLKLPFAWARALACPGRSGLQWNQPGPPARSET